MAADVVLRARGPGGASHDLGTVAHGAGLVAEAAGFEGKLPSTAVRRPGRLGLNLAGRRNGPVRRRSCASGARAAPCWAVRPSILVPTSRNNLGRVRPAVNSWMRRRSSTASCDTCPIGKTPVAARRANRPAATSRPFSRRNSAASASRYDGRRDRRRVSIITDGRGDLARVKRGTMSRYRHGVGVGRSRRWRG